MKKYLLALCCFILGVATLASAATNKYAGSPAAKTEFDKGTAAKHANDWDTAIADYKKAIELDPNFAAAHLAYVEASLVGAAYRAQKAPQGGAGQARDAFGDIIKEYQGLVKEHPKMPVYLWVLAMTQVYQDPALKEANCKKTVEMDPAFGPGYGCIASVAQLRGDSKTAAEYLRKALASDPNNKSLWSQLQQAVSLDPEEFERTTKEIVNKFPNDEVAPQALYTYAQSLPQSEQIAKLQEIVTQYPPNKFHFTSIAAGVLFGLYDRTDPAKATALAHTISSEMPEDKGWKANVGYEDSLATADSKVAAGDGAGALAILKDVHPSPFISSTRLQLLTAKAHAAAGDTQAAYSDLLKVFAEAPAPEMQPALYQYGNKLGKSNKSVDDEVWNLRSSNAKPAIPFSLESFTDGKKVSLEEFKGKVVLLDFWYPSCGPCLEAMPYLQDLYSKYKDSGLVFIGINGMEGEGNFVMPLVKSRGWGFIPLKGSQKWGEDVYHVQGYPSTFLIGADGKVYFKLHTYDREQHDVADMEIRALLAAAQQNKREDHSR